MTQPYTFSMYDFSSLFPFSSVFLLFESHKYYISTFYLQNVNRKYKARESHFPWLLPPALPSYLPPPPNSSPKGNQCCQTFQGSTYNITSLRISLFPLSRPLASMSWKSSCLGLWKIIHFYSIHLSQYHFDIYLSNRVIKSSPLDSKLCEKGRHLLLCCTSSLSYSVWPTGRAQQTFVE